MNDSEFTINHNKINRGFQMTFANGWTISVQFGPGNYCSNRDYTPYPKLYNECKNAEIALIDPDGNLDYNPEWHDQVKGFVTPDEVVDWIHDVKRFAPERRARPYPGIGEDD